MQTLNVKKYVVASVASFALIFVFDWILHGVLLKPIYESTPNLWRKPEDFVFWSMLLGQVVLPFVLACVFVNGYEGKGIREGARFGLLMGVLFAPNTMIMYAVQPLPVPLVAAWVTGGIIEMVLVGMVLAVLYQGPVVKRG